MEEFVKEFKRVESNPIYFLEKYYNVINEKKLELSDDEKQEIFDKFKAIPFFNDFKIAIEHSEKVEKLKENGFKDWEIL